VCTQVPAGVPMMKPTESGMLCATWNGSTVKTPSSMMSRGRI
jgi:hypothetical protein